VGNAVKTFPFRSPEGGAKVGNIIEIALGIISAVGGNSLGLVWSSEPVLTFHDTVQ